MEQSKTLTNFSIIDTNCIEQSEVAISRSLSDVSIMRADRDRFQLQMNGVDFGRSSLVFNRFGSETKIKAGMAGKSILFVIGGSSPTKMILDEGSVVVSSQKAAMILPGKLKGIERTAGSEVFVLRTPLSELLHHFEELIAWHHRGSIVFDHSINLTKGPGVVLKRIINNLAFELTQNASVLQNPSFRKTYDEMLLTALLSLPHNQNKKLNNYRRYQVAPELVRRAEEYMRAHLEETVSIIDLLRICVCSRRALFSAFCNARSYTPMEFLTEQRLQRAQNRLLKSDVETSVSSIALECGFTHLGRFSQVYKKRFGELPSDTLKKNNLKKYSGFISIKPNSYWLYMVLAVTGKILYRVIISKRYMRGQKSGWL